MGGTTQIHPVLVFVIAFFTAAAAGAATYLRSNKDKVISVLALITSSLNAGLLGLAISLLRFDSMKDNIYMLLGICLISGLGGISGLELIVATVQKMALQSEAAKKLQDVKIDEETK